MYSRYSNINIPQNYSGNRFKIETETKLHKATTINGVKNAHSPSFVSSIKKQNQLLENEKIEEIEDDFSEEDDLCEDSIEDNDTYYENNIIEEDKLCDIKETILKKENHKGFDFSSIKNIFNDINSEELLILGIILLIASDKDGFSDGTLWILSLLLLSRNNN